MSTGNFNNKIMLNESEQQQLNILKIQKSKLVEIIDPLSRINVSMDKSISESEDCC
ncbi:hypothetical protein [Paenibacillus macquariensis]|uniref:hypothetical protein n=1 Tax=Paenibacillus macquariensis TaxID=948756 RepID=UPI0014719473|nr:hypothetical protein [Paenibacillus macquariensis]